MSDEVTLLLSWLAGDIPHLLALVPQEEHDDDDEDEDDDEEVELPKRGGRAPSKPTAAAVVTSDKPLTSKALQQALQAALDVLKAGG